MKSSSHNKIALNHNAAHAHKASHGAAHPGQHAHGQPHHGSQLLVSKKHFQKDGKWIVKPSTTVVLTCTCGNKYIATRPKQTTCIKCIVSVSVTTTAGVPAK